MLIRQFQFSVQTAGRGLFDLTETVSKLATQANMSVGICHLFLHHTSASLILSEHADPLVKSDLETFMQRLVPDSDSLYEHNAEGPDDMPAHIRSVLTQSFLSIPLTHKCLALGKWQGIYLWEHRVKPHQRHLTLTILGQDK